jgi:GT2 family glycosyltransferase
VTLGGAQGAEPASGGAHLGFVAPEGAAERGTVTVVIVNWNRRDCVLSLLDSLRSLDHGSLRVIVVDNASSDGSAAAVRAHALPVLVLENSENLGGTGGFNTGIFYALEHFEQQFIWLLDNDAEVTPATLAGMLEVMADDSAIGIVGSCILSPEDHALIVEVGGFVEPARATWKPHRRYQRHEECTGRNLVEEVDYVPACSALVRSDLFRKIGVLDQRYFLHWDDIDFCARARRAGFRVVAALDSLVYHGAEKGHSRMTLYYDFRNALLFFSKAGPGAPLLRPFWALLTRNLTSFFYFLLTGRQRVAGYLYQGLSDFLKGCFGRVDVPSGSLASEPRGEEVQLGHSLAGSKKVVVFAAGSYEEVVGALRALKKASPQLQVVLAVAADRAEAYRHAEADRLITYDLFRDGAVRKVFTAADILGSRFQLGISAGSAFTVPYAFLVRRNLVFDAQSGRCSASDISLCSLWKLPLAMLLGYLLALLFLVPVLITARQCKERPL